MLGFLATRLLLDRFALAYTARTALGIQAPVREFWSLARGRDDRIGRPPSSSVHSSSFSSRKCSGSRPTRFTESRSRNGPSFCEKLSRLRDWSDGEFSTWLMNAGFVQTLDAIALHARRPTSRPQSPRFQAVFCIDEREESFRRHLEEVVPDVETFGVAGFYAVAIYYKGAADAHFTPLCPVMIRPESG